MGDFVVPIGHGKGGGVRWRECHLVKQLFPPRMTSALTMHGASYGYPSSPLPAVRHAYTLLVMQDDWGGIARLVECLPSFRFEQQSPKV